MKSVKAYYLNFLVFETRFRLILFELTQVEITSVLTFSVYNSKFHYANTTLTLARHRFRQTVIVAQLVMLNNIFIIKIEYIGHQKTLQYKV